MKTIGYRLQEDLYHKGWEARQTIEMPCGAKILSVTVQAGVPTVWALVNPEAATETRYLYITEGETKLGDEFVGRRFIGTLPAFRDSAMHIWE
jgi:hypothetical protein